MIALLHLLRGAPRCWRRSAALACCASLLSASAAAGAPAKIGVLLKGDTDFWAAAEAGCRDAARQAGVEIVVRRPQLESDIDGQIRLLGEMADQGISALVIAPCSGTALSGPVAAVAAKGVKIVVIDSPLDLDVPAYIATNHTNAGAAAGALLGSLVDAGDEVAIVRHSHTSGANLLRESSAYAAIYAAHPGIVVHRDLYAGEVPGQELPRVRTLFARYPNTRAVLCSSTPVSMAMLQALQASGRPGAVKFVGFGFNLNSTVAAGIEQGWISGWVSQLPGEVGARGVNTALALLRHESVPEVAYCDFRVITKDNLHTPEVQALLPAAGAPPAGP
ncbi:MAG TPA: substrate-binding domain-containing protein [Opitutaceae bacterium]|jgi:ribose transport system substrate-binding protein|nr:substrate-binding domain-containing protein [Opitutaceae bacterium]